MMGKIAAILVAIVLLSVCLAGCGNETSPVETVNGRETSQAETANGGETSAVETAKTYTTLLESEDFARAYDMLTAASREGMTYEEFAEIMGFGLLQAGLEGASFELVQQTSTSATVVIYGTDGYGNEFLLFYEGGAWKVSLGEEYESAASPRELRDCLSNQRNFLGAADIFACETGYYPNAANYAAGAVVGPDGTNAGAWPADYYRDSMAANAPTCPGGGTVTITYNGVDARPTSSCSLHGSPSD